MKRLACAWVLLALCAATAHSAPAGAPPDLRQPPGGRGSGRSGGPSWASPAERERVRVRIGLSVEQGKRIEELHADFEKQRRALMTRRRDLYTRLRSVYEEYDFDRRVADGVRHQIVAIHEEQSRLMAQNEEKLRKIVTREQFAKMRDMMREERDSRGRGRPGPPPGGPPGM